MANNRELSQLASLITVDDSNRVIDITTSVGIGITNPGSELQVAGPSAGIRLTDNTGATGDLSSTGWLIYQRPSNAISNQSGLTFQRDSTEVITFDTSGNIYLNAGQGIDFSSSSGGGATNSLLDDYEEGTWTPVVSDATSAGNTGSGTFYGHYTKVGNLVTATVSITNLVTTGMTAGNNLHIQGLPYTAGSLTGTIIFTGAVQTANTTGVSFALSCVDNTSYLRIVANQSTNQPAYYNIVSEFTSGSADIYGTITYRTAT